MEENTSAAEQAPPISEAEAVASKQERADAEEATASFEQAMTATVWDMAQREKMKNILHGEAEQKASETTKRLKTDESLVQAEAGDAGAAEYQAFQSRNAERQRQIEDAKARAFALLDKIVEEPEEAETGEEEIELGEATLAEKKEVLEAEKAEEMKKAEAVETAEKVSAEPEPVEAETKERADEQPLSVEQWQQEAATMGKNIAEVTALRSAYQAKPERNASESAYLAYAEAYLKMAETRKRYAEAGVRLSEKDGEADAVKAEMQTEDEKSAANFEEKQKLFESKTMTEKRLASLNQQLENPALTPEERNRYAYDARRLRGELTVLRSHIEDVENEGKAIEEAREARKEKLQTLEKELDEMLTAQEALRKDLEVADSGEAAERKTYEAALAAPAEAESAAMDAEEKKEGTRLSAVLETSKITVGVASVATVGTLKGASWMLRKTADALDWASKLLGRPRWLSWIMEKTKPKNEEETEK